MKTRVSKKTATKNCPRCHEQVPTACKSCGCGHLFKKLSAPGHVQAETPSDAVKRRRTERTRRERPHYYSAIEYEPFPRRRRKAGKCVSDDNVKKKVHQSLTPPPAPATAAPTTTAPATTTTTATAAVTSNSNGKTKDRDADKEQSSTEGRESASRTPKEDDPFSKVTPEKALQYAVILQEINRKFGAQNFVPG